MIKETADNDPLVFIFKIHILSLKLTYQKGAKIDDVTAQCAQRWKKLKWTISYFSTFGGFIW